MQPYDYEVKIKSWSELVSLADYSNSSGLHFGKIVLNQERFLKLQKEKHYAIDTGFMGMLVYFNEIGEQIKDEHDIFFVKFYNYFKTDKLPIFIGGDDLEEHS